MNHVYNDFEYGIQNGDMYITLTLDDDSELECSVIAIFPADGRDYVALIPCNDSERVFLYRFFCNDGNVELDNIEDDDEYDLVAATYNNLVDNEEGNDFSFDDN